MNALISITEINSLYDQRPIIEKQASYAFVHPFAEALGGIVSDVPVKFAAAVVFNIIFYFLCGFVSASSHSLRVSTNRYSDTNRHNSLFFSYLHLLVRLRCQESSVLWLHQPKPLHKPCPWLVC